MVLAFDVSTESWLDARYPRLRRARVPDTVKLTLEPRDVTIDAWIGTVSAAAALMAAIFAFVQARSAKRSAATTEAQLEQARIQAEAARRQAGAAEEQINLMLREMHRSESVEKAIQLEREHQHLARLAAAVGLRSRNEIS